MEMYQAPLSKGVKMEMYQAPLNKAHQLERRAQSLEKHNKVDEAIGCYIDIVDLYQKCLESGENKHALESIQLQKEHAERQLRILQIKQAYMERTAKERKLKVSLSKHSQIEAVENLQDKIFKNLETHDSLICYLADRGIINSRDGHCHSTIEEAEEKEEGAVIIGSKHPKPDSVVIEELRELSGQLKGSVQGLLIDLVDRKNQIEQLKQHIINKSEIDYAHKADLLIELDDRNILIEQLRAQIKGLELEKSCNEGSQSNASELEEKESPDSSSEISSEIAQLKSLPKLDNLLLPEFDVSLLKRFNIPDVSPILLRKKE